MSRSLIVMSSVDFVNRQLQGGAFLVIGYKIIHIWNFYFLFSSFCVIDTTEEYWVV